MPDTDMPPAAVATPVLDIVCLCAAWCGTCREYEATFAELQQAAPGHRYRWIDIEDEAELVGEVDVETFPTLLVAHAGQVLFAGPVLPRLSDAQRLVTVQLAAVQRAAAQRPMSPVPEPTPTPTPTPTGLPADQAEAYTALAARLGT